MEKLLIQGGHRLEGQIPISGAKNSALPALAACLLTREPVKLDRIPRVRDIRTMEKLLSYTGANVEIDGAQVRVQADDLNKPEAPYDLVKTMRASSLVLGPLVARTGRARVSMPGGCAIGSRPINLHVSALEQLGAEIRTEHGYVEAVAPRGLRGTCVHFDRITVTGTEDLLMAATLAQGETVIENAAREPEVQDLAALLVAMGARIDGAGTARVEIEGVDELHPAEHCTVADRIEAATYLAAVGLAGGEVTVLGAQAAHMDMTLEKLSLMGLRIEALIGGIHAGCEGRLASVDFA
ncbi:MAG TPA: UDP-N-acetylglucosamine 1-carboxyvinyltransferase, partial [Bryobacteraceae bacterium]|nr:UDP-N-acetylglucosamine 1-carboxyvinyltransferase [Bryobacteraceae bacterium]